MKLWHKMLLILVAMLVASFAFGRLWLWAFGFVIPSYLAGVVGGLVAIPLWELLRALGRTPS
jgi:hypothetical protein